MAKLGDPAGAFDMPPMTFSINGLEKEQLERLQTRDPGLARSFLKWLWHREITIHKLEQDHGAEYRYWELTRLYAAKSHFWYAVLPIYSAPLMLRAQRLVEFGTAFTYYPDTYNNDRWGLSTSDTDGMVSTRILLSACRILETMGINSKLTSIEVRGQAIFEGVDITHNGDQLFSDLGLRQYWNPIFGMDSAKWLAEQKQLIAQGEEQPVDFALLDSNHTYHLTKAELEGLAAITSDQAVIIIDNCYTLFYEPNADWSPDETPDGIRHGGKYGAIVEFAESHADWEIEWFPYPLEIAYLKKGFTKGFTR